MDDIKKILNETRNNITKRAKKQCHCNKKAAMKGEKNIMNDEFEDIAYLGRLYEELLNSRNVDDFKINEVQFAKFAKVVEFFTTAAQECNGKVEPIILDPRAEHGGIAATFIVFDIYGDGIPQFCEVMSYASAISIDATYDGICISVTVPDVFVPIEK